MNQRSANAKLTDVEYDLVKDLLPCGSFKGGNRPNNRLFIDVCGKDGVWMASIAA